MNTAAIGRLLLPPLIAAGLTICLIYIACIVAGLVVGLSWGLHSDMPGWAILTGPVGISFGIKGFVTGLPVGLAVAAGWVIIAILLARFLLKPDTGLALAAVHGLIIGLPGLVASLMALNANTFLNGQLYNDGHPHLKFAAQWAAVMAPMAAGIITVIQLRMRSQPLDARPRPDGNGQDGRVPS